TLCFGERFGLLSPLHHKTIAVGPISRELQFLDDSRQPRLQRFHAATLLIWGTCAKVAIPSHHKVLRADPCPRKVGEELIKIGLVRPAQARRAGQKATNFTRAVVLP